MENPPGRDCAVLRGSGAALGLILDVIHPNAGDVIPVESGAERSSVRKSGVRVVSISFALIARTEEVVQSDSKSRSSLGSGSEAFDRRVVTTEETECADIDPGAPAWTRGKVDGPRIVRA